MPQIALPLIILPSRTSTCTVYFFPSISQFSRRTRANHLLLRHDVEVPPSIKMRFCGYCFVLFTPGQNCDVRLKPYRKCSKQLQSMLQTSITKQQQGATKSGLPPSKDIKKSKKKRKERNVLCYQCKICTKVTPFRGTSEEFEKSIREIAPISIRSIVPKSQQPATSTAKSPQQQQRPQPHSQNQWISPHKQQPTQKGTQPQPALTIKNITKPKAQQPQSPKQAPKAKAGQAKSPLPQQQQPQQGAAKKKKKKKKKGPTEQDTLRSILQSSGARDGGNNSSDGMDLFSFLEAMKK